MRDVVTRSPVPHGTFAILAFHRICAGAARHGGARRDASTSTRFALSAALAAFAGRNFFGACVSAGPRAAARPRRPRHVRCGRDRLLLCSGGSRTSCGESSCSKCSSPSSSCEPPRLFARSLLSPAGRAPIAAVRGCARRGDCADPRLRLRLFTASSFATSSVLGASGASPETVDSSVSASGSPACCSRWRPSGAFASRSPTIRGADDRRARSSDGSPTFGRWPRRRTSLSCWDGGIFNVLAGVAITNGTGFASMVLFVALPIVDMALCRALACPCDRRRTNRARRPRRRPGGVRADLPARHSHRVLVVGLWLLAGLWSLDLFALAQASLGGRIASALLGIGVVLLATYMLWGILEDGHRSPPAGRGDATG